MKPVLTLMCWYMRRPQNRRLATLAEYKLALEYRRRGATNVGVARMMYWHEDKARLVLASFQQIVTFTRRAKQIGYVHNSIVPPRQNPGPRNRIPAEHRRQIVLELLGDRLLNALERMPKDEEASTRMPRTRTGSLA